MHHHEVAAAGQCEIGTKFAPLVQRADWMQILKYTVWNVAASYGKTATFMPKPVVGDNGSGMHVHQSVWKGGNNLFAGNLYAGLSEFALHYIGGIIKHASAECDHQSGHQLLHALLRVRSSDNLAYSRASFGLRPIPFVSSPRRPCGMRFPTRRTPISLFRDADAGWTGRTRSPPLRPDRQDIYHLRRSSMEVPSLRVAGRALEHLIRTTRPHKAPCSRISSRLYRTQVG